MCVVYDVCYVHGECVCVCVCASVIAYYVIIMYAVESTNDNSVMLI